MSVFVCVCVCVEGVLWSSNIVKGGRTCHRESIREHWSEIRSDGTGTAVNV